MIKFECELLLDKVESVKKFVHFNTMHTCEVDVLQNRQVIDGKSIMGVFSLDLSKPVKVVVMAEGDDELNAIKEVYKEFMVA